MTNSFTLDYNAKRFKGEKYLILTTVDILYFILPNIYKSREPGF